MNVDQNRSMHSVLPSDISSSQDAVGTSNQGYRREVVKDNLKQRSRKFNAQRSGYQDLIEEVVDIEFNAIALGSLCNLSLK
ncbi:uncharacterized protein Bfra_000143 [Botrytis fragariae]|uniref:Uncharacterized protein n=1 Tax=Botrytis fragariae TaxID=1964551 RepID=A0A8H6B2J2_9HELO|nr:uncharacterized protein Bfra_000143 [Botrytis fragariae]KAF5877978.1 hypothetical protein Bfra_000143 [Botrytis fragariae]